MGDVMKILGFKSQEKYPKVTSYLIKINNKNILLDYGVCLNNPNILNNIDYIFISHEHGDHIYGLVTEFEKINNKVKIFMTTTCKEIMLSKSDDKLYDFLDNHITNVYFDDTINVDGIDITFYQAGHTFGSACILLKGEYSIFYTGDINYATFDDLCSYNVPYYLDVDYMILDGTALSKDDDFKKMTLTHLKKDVQKHKKYYINARSEKAVFIAKYLSEFYDNVYYEPDLREYLTILMNQGYEPFREDKIGYDTTSEYKNAKTGIFISSTDFSNYNKDYVLSLHISREDINDFIARFKRVGKVLIGHSYHAEAYDGFTILKEGGNEV